MENPEDPFTSLESWCVIWDLLHLLGWGGEKNKFFRADKNLWLGTETIQWVSLT